MLSFGYSSNAEYFLRKLEILVIEAIDGVRIRFCRSRILVCFSRVIRARNFGFIYVDYEFTAPGMRM